MTKEQKRKVSDLRRAGMGYTETARRAGVSRNTVRSFCRRNGLAGEAAKDEPRDGPAQEGICRECGKQFDVYGDSRRKYCSHGCYIKSRFGGGGADE